MFMVVAFVSVPFGIWYYYDTIGQKTSKLNFSMNKQTLKTTTPTKGKKAFKKKLKAVLKDNNTKVSLIK